MKRITRIEWNHIHADYKGEINGSPSILELCPDSGATVLTPVEVLDLVPMPGDAVILRGRYTGIRPGSVGIINGVVGEARDEYLVTWNLYGGGAFRGPSFRGSMGRETVSASGGPVPWVRAIELRPAGRHVARFWRWRDLPRAGGGEEYELEVNLWEWTAKDR